MLTLDVTRPLSLSTRCPPAADRRQAVHRAARRGRRNRHLLVLPRRRRAPERARCSTPRTACSPERRARQARSSPTSRSRRAAAAPRISRSSSSSSRGSASPPSRFASGKVGRRYSGQIVVKGGIAPVALSSTSVFPPGVTLNGETGRLSGKPLQAGAYRIAVTLKDSYGGIAAKRYTILIRR